ncbi:MAG TPA: potassium channel protein [Bryobacteraceae bacterium]|jgi:voltage-gated potassium channel|nr:potassium channel protein [Bryobacteraceae bacterium]
MRQRLLRRVLLCAGVLLFIIAFGTAGFQLIDRYPPFDAFYMTLMTITTVGYAEIHPLSKAGRIFNSFLILFGVSGMFFSVGALTQTIIELELGDPLGQRRIKRMIDKMQNHFLICGYGRVGRSAAAELKRAGVPFLVIDRSEERVDRAINANMAALLADATRDETLRAAGVTRARGLIAALASDADNLYVILSAKTLNPSLTVVTRAAEEESEKKLQRAGADTVFAPYNIVGHRLAHALLRPHVAQFLDFATKNMGLDVAIEQVRVSPQSEFVNKTLRDMQIRRDLGVIVLAIRKSDGQMVFNPPAEMEICADDYLIAMGEQPNLQNLEELLTSVRRP